MINKTFLALFVYMVAIGVHIATTAAEKYPDFTRQIYVNGVGQAKLEYAFTGEPISRPRSLTLFIKCKKGEPWRELGTYLMCELKDYNYDAKTKKLSIKYIDGRVNQETGESICDQLGESEFDFSNVCKIKN